MKKIIAIAFFTIISLGAYAQSSATAYVNSLDRTVSLTTDQRTEVTDLFNGLMSTIQGKTAEEIQAAKVTFNADVRKVLTPSQVAILDSRYRTRQ